MPKINLFILFVIFLLIASICRLVFVILTIIRRIGHMFIFVFLVHQPNLRWMRNLFSCEVPRDPHPSVVLFQEQYDD